MDKRIIELLISNHNNILPKLVNKIKDMIMLTKIFNNSFMVIRIILVW